MKDKKSRVSTEHPKSNSQKYKPYKAHPKEPDKAKEEKKRLTIFNKLVSEANN